MRSLKKQDARAEFRGRFELKRQLYDEEEDLAAAEEEADADGAVATARKREAYLSNLASHIAFSFQAC